MSRLIDADKLKEDIAKGNIVIDEEVLKCETIHDMLLYLLKKVDDLMIANIDAQPTVEYSWIPISERLPKNRTTVIVKTSLNCVYVGYRLNNGFYGRDTEHMHFMKDVRAWMPLPLPYKEGEEE